MSKIKKEQCPSCGGSLIDDSEKQMYRCTSCGAENAGKFCSECGTPLQQ